VSCLLFRIQTARVAPDRCGCDMKPSGVIYSSTSTDYKNLTLCHVISSSGCIHNPDGGKPLF